MVNDFNFIKDNDRSKAPKIESRLEGRKTIITNWSDILKAINADSIRKKHLIKFLAHESAAKATEKMPTKLIFNTKVTPGILRDLMANYMAKFVLCEKCGKPDSFLIEEKRNLLLRCEACGNIAHLEKI